MAGSFCVPRVRTNMASYLALMISRPAKGGSCYSRTLCSRNNASRRGLGFVGTSRAFMNASHCSSSRRNKQRSAMTSAASASAASSTNSVTVLFLAVAASCKTRFTPAVVRVYPHVFDIGFPSHGRSSFPTQACDQVPI